MNAVVLQHVGESTGIAQVIDGDNVKFARPSGHGTKSNATDTTKTVDCYSNSHCCPPSVIEPKCGISKHRREIELAVRGKFRRLSTALQTPLDDGPQPQTNIRALLCDGILILGEWPNNQSPHAQVQSTYGDACHGTCAVIRNQAEQVPHRGCVTGSLRVPFGLWEPTWCKSAVSSAAANRLLPQPQDSASGTAQPRTRPTPWLRRECPFRRWSC